ncbi:hypothetical protein FSP39_022020 [Pinctada imbricata]|uniref:C1q domain-containing protein n=1 Tax=Pinctada imbricata TaxID=66713 RepID=A0AA88Y5Q3_PINIB|nr:hypothetical protein FSP39_022020 [Pinctada imbricata]
MFLRLILSCFFFDFAFSTFARKEEFENALEILHEKYTKRIDELQNKFEEKFRIQDERIRILEERTRNQDESINSLQKDFSEKSELVKYLSEKLNYVDQNIGVMKSQIENDFENKTMSSQIPQKRDASLAHQIKQKTLHSEKPEFYRQERILLPTNTIQSSKVIAFYAYLSANLPAANAGPGHVLVFDVAKTNIGNAYHPHTGVFIVPETGVYVFTWGFYIGGTDNYHSLELVVNAEVWGIVHTHSVAASDYKESTGVVVVQANAGDDVFVRSSATYAHGSINSDHASKTFFAGWKL